MESLHNTGTSQLDGNVKIGDTGVQSSLTVVGPTYVNDTITAGGLISGTDGIHISDGQDASLLLSNLAFNVTGVDTTLSRDLNVTLNEDVGGNLTVHGSTALEGLSAKDTSIDGDISIDGDLTQLSGTTSLRSTTITSLDVTENAEVTGSVDVAGVVYADTIQSHNANSPVLINDDLWIESTKSLTASEIHTGTISPIGLGTSVEVDAALNVTGDVALSANLAVTGTTQLADDLTITGNITQTQNSGTVTLNSTTVNGNIESTGVIKTNTIQPYGSGDSVTVDGPFVANDNVTIGTDGDNNTLTVYADESIYGNETVYGNEIVQGSVSVGSLSVSGLSTFNDNVTVISGKTLNVSSITGNGSSGNPPLSIETNTTFQHDLTVLGDTTLKTVDVETIKVDTITSHTLNNAVVVDDGLQVNNGLVVSNGGVITSTISGPSNNSLQVICDLEVSGSTTSTGLITGLAGLTVTGTTQVQTLGVTGPLTSMSITDNGSSVAISKGVVVSTGQGGVTTDVFHGALDGNATTSTTAQNYDASTGTIKAHVETHAAAAVYGHTLFDAAINTGRNSTTVAISEQGIIDFVNQSVNNVAAYYITTSNGEPFATKAALNAATVNDLYSGGQQRTPTRNDYTIVQSDESHVEYNLYDGFQNFTSTSEYIGHYIKNTGTPVTYTLVTSSNHNTLSIVPGTTEAYERIVPSSRYTYTGEPGVAYSSAYWSFQYTFNQQYTQAQMASLNSGITAAKVAKLDGIEAGAQVNIIESIIAGSSALSISNKAVTLPIVTAWGTESNDKIPSSQLVKTTLDAKVDDTQLVTSWSSTTTNTNIPSEKLTKDSLDAKLDDTQLVTAFQSTPDNTHIPSEKLVKDSLDAKLDDTQLKTSWSSTVSDSNIPSEKLTKDTLDTKVAYKTGITFTADHIVTFDDTTGKVIKDSGHSIDNIVKQTLTSANYNLPLLLADWEITTTATTKYGAPYRNNSIYANPSTGIITATGFAGNLTGNVTGNLTGNVTGNLTGNVTGNADTATALATARTINGTSFDGSANITTASWGTGRTVTLSDNDGTNTESNTGIDGSANFTLKLPATIKASITGNCSGSSGSCTGNSATATALQVVSTSAIATTAGVQIISTTILSQAGYWFIETYTSGTNIMQRATSLSDPSCVAVRSSTDSGTTWAGWLFPYAVWRP